MLIRKLYFNCVSRNLREVDLDVAKCEDNGSLVIIDSVRGYFGSEADVLCFVKIAPETNLGEVAL
jgi:hypothetical protein